jgi:hypothetical protein
VIITSSQQEPRFRGGDFVYHLDRLAKFRSYVEPDPKTRARRYQIEYDGGREMGMADSEQLHAV